MDLHYIQYYFIVVQVWLDLKLPDYMSSITTLVQTEGSAMNDILTLGGYMLLCALGSVAASVIVGYFAVKVAAECQTESVSFMLPVR